MSRPLGDIQLAALMLDGIELKGRCCVVALGITADGVKTPLGQVRLDCQKRGFAAVHVALTNNARGRGGGRDALCPSRVEAARWPDMSELQRLVAS